MNPKELAREMAAARQRREEKTARQLREARAQAIRSGMRPGSSRAEVEERARCFYPRLNEVLLAEAIDIVCGPAKPTQPAPEPTLVDVPASL